ncbi:exodeoxyribonuclease V subunit alpha [Serpens gallinarum]|jgi:exodeoxyribonuclease V alpha subunit|uniref:RecBCD enzyme subunit RecD n=1 Tax=Serpens gallinarum TaxID=2763075 RepID=A0ABR8TLW3_9PSED|nr:exodeoxyribonuclease V subunit alpha [Serpens gallinarum]MBD7976757.1 exodeoxyribonuclease V subunit alpha [Serpens gallinarum]
MSTLEHLAQRLRDEAGPSPANPLLEREALLVQLDLWVRRGWLRALDRAFAAFLLEQEPDASPLLLLAAALASHQLGQGHVCLDLAATLEEPDFALSLPPEGELAGEARLPSQLLADLDVARWQQALIGSALVEHRAPGAANDPAQAARPLLLAGGRLYLRRYWNYEQSVARILRQRLAQPLTVPADLPARLDALFPRDDAARLDWQKLACALAARGSFSLITGGPGTGKTTTVVRLLALLQAPAVAAGQALRIRLAAPTGKAAARLTESIGAQVAGLTVSSDVREAIPTEVVTLHRLLGSRPDTRHFRHHAGHPLALDVLVVDEASMIDLEMMARLLEALPAHARLILLGDKDQLASVEAGAVLGDLCRDAEAGFYDPATRAWLEQLGGQPLDEPGLLPGSAGTRPLAQQTVMLRHSRRFGADSGIGRLARLVNQQQAGEARALLSAPSNDVFNLRLRGEQDRHLARLLSDGRDTAPGYRHYLMVLQGGRPLDMTPLEAPDWQDWAKNVLAAFDGFRLLCALRKGDWGVAGLNMRVEAELQRQGLIDASHEWYEGRPVLITRNDYGLGLMNGDIGIALLLPGDNGPLLRVAFPRNDGSGQVRFVLPSRLTAVETVFAMTVHKSQGSEFTHTALVLPDTLNPVLTKELLYTAITRARDYFTLVEPRGGVFEAAVQRKVKRLSGLMLELQGQG